MREGKKERERERRKERERERRKESNNKQLGAGRVAPLSISCL